MSMSIFKRLNQNQALEMLFKIDPTNQSGLNLIDSKTNIYCLINGYFVNIGIKQSSKDLNKEVLDIDSDSVGLDEFLNNQNYQRNIKKGDYLYPNYSDTEYKEYSILNDIPNGDYLELTQDEVNKINQIIDLDNQELRRRAKEYFNEFWANR